MSFLKKTAVRRPNIILQTVTTDFDNNFLYRRVATYKLYMILVKIIFFSKLTRNNKQN